MPGSPFAILPIYVSLEKIDRSLLEAATDLGDKPVERFLRVTLPLSLPGVISSALLVFIPTVGDYITPTQVGGTSGIMIGNTHPVAVRQGQQLAAGRRPVDRHDAGGDRHRLPLLVGRRLPQDAGQRGLTDGSRNAPRLARRLRDLASWLLLYGPVLLLPLFSFNDSIYIAFPLKGFTTQWYRQMVENPALMAALKNSLKVGICVAVVSTVLGLLAAKAVTRYRLPGKAPIIGMIMLPLVVPSIILGIALLVILRKVFDVELSLWTIGAGHVLICMPFSMLVLISRLEGFDKSLEEASLDLGESGWRTFWRVTFPLALPGIVSSLLLCLHRSRSTSSSSPSSSAATTRRCRCSSGASCAFPPSCPACSRSAAASSSCSFIIVVLADLVRRRGVQSAQPTAF